MIEWQPIETAPEDCPVLTYRAVGLMAVAENIKESARKPVRAWCCTDGVFLLDVTHWMPLPDPPTEKAE